jgi:hypothetical protein
MIPPSPSDNQIAPYPPPTPPHSVFDNPPRRSRIEPKPAPLQPVVPRRERNPSRRPQAQPPWRGTNPIRPPIPESRGAKGTQATPPKARSPRRERNPGHSAQGEKPPARNEPKRFPKPFPQDFLRRANATTALPGVPPSPPRFTVVPSAPARTFANRLIVRPYFVTLARLATRFAPPRATDSPEKSPSHGAES